MSEDTAAGTLDVLRRYADAWAAGDAATVVSLYHDDIVLHYFGDNPLAGDHAGKPAALAALGKISAATNRGAPRVHDVMASENHGTILVEERWTVDSAEMSVRRVMVYHVREGKLSECWVYDEDQRMVDAILSRVT
jgi:ketosteroid isomerase-like protein